MKKILFILAVSLAFFAKADYIYWMIDSNPVNVQQFDSTTKSVEWNNAILSYDGSKIGEMTSTQWSDLNDLGAYAYAGFTPSGSGTSTFMIELYSGDTWLGKTEASADALKQYIFGNNSMSVMPASAFGIGAPYAVPEPTSGLLFLVGGVLLGLKRRREVV